MAKRLEQHTPRPDGLPGLTAMGLAQAGSWDVLGALLHAAPPQGLAQCGALLAAAAKAGQYALLPLAAVKLDEVAPQEVVAALKVGAEAGQLHCPDSCCTHPARHLHLWPTS